MASVAPPPSSPLSALSRPQPLREQAYDRIREALRHGKYRPGERLTELGIAQELGVSRTPVREVLGQLAREGFLEEHPRGGFRIPALSLRDVEEIFTLRLLLEPFGAAEAARRATSKDIAALTAVLRRGEEAAPDRLDDFIEAARDFRACLFGIAGNARLLQAIDQVEDHMQYLRTNTLRDRDTRSRVNGHNARMLEAVRRRDAAAAEASMRTQIEGGRKALTATMQAFKRI